MKPRPQEISCDHLTAPRASDCPDKITVQFRPTSFTSLAVFATTKNQQHPEKRPCMMTRFGYPIQQPAAEQARILSFITHAVFISHCLEIQESCPVSVSSLVTGHILQRRMVLAIGQTQQWRCALQAHLCLLRSRCVKALSLTFLLLTIP